MGELSYTVMTANQAITAPSHQCKMHKNISTKHNIAHSLSLSMPRQIFLSAENSHSNDANEGNNLTELQNKKRSCCFFGRATVKNRTFECVGYLASNILIICRIGRLVLCVVDRFVRSRLDFKCS